MFIDPDDSIALMLANGTLRNARQMMTTLSLPTSNGPKSVPALVHGTLRKARHMLTTWSLPASNGQKSAVGPVSYHGGRLIRNVEVVLIYWGGRSNVRYSGRFT